MSKRKISCFLLGNQYLYTVRIKEHWYNKWHYVSEGRYPKLFTLGELIGRIISIEELDKYFRGDSDDLTIVI